MKIDQAISLLKQYIDYNNPDVPDFYTMAEACKVAIKALEQEPCDDAISRQAVLDALDKSKYSNEFCEEHHIDWSINLGMAHIVVNELKPVTPQPKMGHWFIDERPECNREVVCSNCEQPVFKYHKLDFDYRPKYCPNCGAKMQEVEE